MSFTFAQKARVEFIHGARSDSLRIADRKHLCLANSQGIEAGYAGAALLARIRIVQPVIVNK